MKSLQSLAARLDRIEEKMKPPAPSMQWRIVHYFAPMDMPEAEEEAARAAAYAEEEAKNGPINENDSIIWLIRTVNAPREQESTQAETATDRPGRTNGTGSDTEHGE